MVSRYSSRLFFGPVAVGLYRLAERFVESVLELTMRPVAHVSLPHFSRLQNDRPALRDAVVSCLRLSLIVTVPAMLVLAACAPEIFALMGEDWADAATVLQLLAVVGIGKAVVFFTGPLLFAVGRPHLRAIMLWALALLAAATVIAVGWLLTDDSSREQAVGMAASRGIYFLAIVIPVNIIVVCRLTGLSARSLLPYVPAPLFAGLAAVGAVAGLRALGLIGALGPLAALVVAGVAASIAAVAVVLALEPRARELARPVLRRLARRPAAA